MLAVYVLGIFDPAVDAFAVWVGVLAGVGVNLLFFFAYEALFWMWWNVIGFALTYGIGKLLTHVGWIRSGSEAVWSMVCWIGMCVSCVRFYW